MNHLAEHNTIVWLIFIIYTVTALFILPDFIGDRQLPTSTEEHNEQALSFASRFLTRIVLIFPLLFLLGNNI